MAKVLGHTILAPGHTYPFLSVLVELQRRGFETLLSVNSAEPVPPQIGTVPVRPMAWDAPERVPTDRGPRAADAVSYRNLTRTGAPVADGLDQLIVEEHPDFLLIDPMLWGAMVAAEASGLPWASLAHNPLSLRGRGLDVRGPGMRPAHGPIGRLRDRVIDFGMRMSQSRSLDMVNKLRSQRALDLLEDFRHRYLAAPLIIAATAEPFEYPRSDWPRSVAFVGPLIWEPESLKPDWIDALDGGPVLLLAGSTVSEYRTTGDWIRKLFEALADEPLRIVATLPTDEVPHPVPANVVVAPFVPHRYLLDRVRCVICHGGYGITAKALAAGVPVLAIPLALDRFEVARRVEEAAAGVMLRERQLTRKRIQEALRTAIACRPGAERVARAFREAGGAAKAADAIEAHLPAAARRS